MIRWFGFFLVFGIHLLYTQRQDFTTSDFNKADNTALRHKGASLKNLPVLVHNLTEGLANDEEKFRALYTWVSTNIENDYYAYLRTTKKRKKLANDSVALLAWNSSFTPKVIEKLIREKKTACTGYAFLIREMASLVGIPCEIVNGYGRTPNLDLNTDSAPNHSWNAVELNGKWYLCDATWSAGETNFETGAAVFHQEYHDGYFLADPGIFIKNHFPLDIKWTLLESPPTLEHFFTGPVVYKDAAALNILPISPSEMHLRSTKEKTVEFIVESPITDLPLQFDLLLSQGNSNTVVIPIHTRKGRVHSLSHRFTKAGFYDIHLRLEKKIFATYTIRVSRK